MSGDPRTAVEAVRTLFSDARDAVEQVVTTLRTRE
jgi:hypothetical protein